MDKRQLFLWCLYDFANSFVLVNLTIYFSQWLVIDGGLSDFWYNAIFSIVTVVLLFSAPILAAYTDKYGGRKPMLNLSTIGTFICYGGSVGLAYLGSVHMAWIVLLFGAGQYFYQLAFVFYNPMIKDVADDKHLSRASGIGQFTNALGQVLGIAITLPLAASRLDPMMVATVLFFILSVPTMIFFRESKKLQVAVKFADVGLEARAYVKKAYSFFALSAATPVLVAFFFYNDSLLTVSNNYAIFLERVFGTADTVKSILLMVILVMSAVGGIVSGYISDKIGVLKTLKLIIFGWMILLPTMAFIPNFGMFAVVTVFAGLFFGSTWAVSRAYMCEVLPAGELGYGFSFYTLAERFATLVGPLTWGGIIFFAGTEPSSYRLAMLSMTFFVIVGLLILTKRSAQPSPVATA